MEGGSLALGVRDVERSADGYVDVLGRTPIPDNVEWLFGLRCAIRRPLPFSRGDDPACPPLSRKRASQLLVALRPPQNFLAAQAPDESGIAFSPRITKISHLDLLPYRLNRSETRLTTECRFLVYVAVVLPAAVSALRYFIPSNQLTPEINIAPEITRTPWSIVMAGHRAPSNGARSHLPP